MGNDRRAKDILRDLPTRRRLGERLLERVGRRGWDRPNVSVSSRIFAKFNVSDPWDPQSTGKRSESIGLGPVSLRLGSERRQPAPHLTPKKQKSARRKGSRGMGPSHTQAPTSSSGPQLPPGFKPPVGVPRAKTRKKSPPPPPPQNTKRRNAFGGEGPRKLVGALPMRPELAARLQAEEQPQKPATTPNTPAKPPRRRSSNRVGHQVQSSSRKPTVMARNPNLAAPPEDAPPRPPPTARNKKRRHGRFTMTPTRTTSAPVVTAVEEPQVEVVATPAEAAPPPQPPPRPAIPAQANGLDDLFGFAAQEGRMRLGRRKKDPEAGD